MPTYEYECRACNERVEVFQKITDDPLTTCDACGGPLRKILFAAGIIFKGSGFYVTDYKYKENGRNGNGRPSSSEAKASEKSETKEPSAARSD